MLNGTMSSDDSGQVWFYALTLGKKRVNTYETLKAADKAAKRLLAIRGEDGPSIILWSCWGSAKRALRKL